MNPKGHAALVTGGASGLGEGTAIRLAAAGAKVTILDMNIDLARAGGAQPRSQEPLGTRTSTNQLDVRKRSFAGVSEGT